MNVICPHCNKPARKAAGHEAGTPTKRLWLCETCGRFTGRRKKTEKPCGPLRTQKEHEADAE